MMEEARIEYQPRTVKPGLVAGHLYRASPCRKNGNKTECSPTLRIPSPKINQTKFLNEEGLRSFSCFLRVPHQTETCD